MEKIGKKESLEFAMVCAATLILVGLKANADILFILSFAVLLAALMFPAAFKPLAFVWFAFSRILGRIMSQVMLTIVYIIVLIPMGFFRRILWRDPLQLKAFRQSRQSVFSTRAGTVSASELDNPF